MSWRFYPLQDAADCGVLATSGPKSPRVAVFLTPQQAKSLQARKNKAA
jgi:hypothetical protein